jgi:hypothetical protein
MKIVANAALWAGAALGVSVLGLAVLGVDPGAGALRAAAVSAGLGGILGALVALKEGR